MVNFNDDDPDAGKPAGPLRLPPEYDEARLGHSLDPRGAVYARNVYSMTRMAKIHGRKHHIVAAVDAAESVWNYIQDIAREHGDRMPVFVEDSAVENSKGPKIWTPGG
jgi:hypothetical protein